MAAPLLSAGKAISAKILDIAFIPLIGLILIARIRDLPATTLMIVVAAVSYTTKNMLAEEGGLRDIGFNWVDISTLVVLASEILNYFASIYRLNTLHSLVDVSFLFLLYWTLRVNLKHEYQFIGILVVLTIFGAYFTGKVIYAFGPQYQYMRYLRLADLSDFRERINLLTPGGMAGTEWITLFLVFLPSPILLLIKYKHITYGRLPPIMFLPAVCCSYELTNPQSFNRYAYVQNDPVNFVDPTGLEPNAGCSADNNFSDCYGSGGGGFWGGGYQGGTGWGSDPRPGLGVITTAEGRYNNFAFRYLPIDEGTVLSLDFQNFGVWNGFFGFGGGGRGNLQKSSQSIETCVASVVGHYLGREALTLLKQQGLNAAIGAGFLASRFFLTHGAAGSIAAGSLSEMGTQGFVRAHSLGAGVQSA